MSFQKSNKPTASSSPQFKIETCKIKICKGYPLFWVHTRVYHLDRAWTWAHQLLDASCHRNPLPIPSWKVQNKICKGFPLRRNHTWVYHSGSGLLHRISTRPIIALLSDILLSKFPQFKVEKLKMKICKGFPIRRVQTQAYHLNIGLELGLDLDLHY